MRPLCWPIAEDQVGGTEADHMVPHSDSGGNEAASLQLTPICDRSKREGGAIGTSVLHPWSVGQPASARELAPGAAPRWAATDRCRATGGWRRGASARGVLGVRVAVT